MKGYNPSIFYPKRTDKPLYHALTTQCVKIGLSFVESVPSAEEISRNYDVIVDALFGFSFQGPPRGEFATVISNIVDSHVPVLSVDVPSGRTQLLILCFMYYVSYVCIHVLRIMYSCIM